MALASFLETQLRRRVQPPPPPLSPEERDFILSQITRSRSPFETWSGLGRGISGILHSMPSGRWLTPYEELPEASKGLGFLSPLTGEEAKIGTKGAAEFLPDIVALAAAPGNIGLRGIKALSPTTETGLTRVGLRAGQAALAPVAGIELATGAVLKYGIAIPAKMVGKGASKAGVKVFEKTLDRRLTHWIATQGVNPAQQSALGKFIVGKRAKVIEFATKRISDRLTAASAKRQGFQYVAKVATEDTIKDIEKNLMPEFTRTQTDITIQGIKAGKFTGQPAPSVTAVQGVVGKLGKVPKPIQEAAQREMAAQAPVTPEVTGWRQSFEDTTDIFRKAQILRGIADSERVTAKELEDVLSRVSGLPEEANIRWAVASKQKTMGIPTTPEVKPIIHKGGRGKYSPRQQTLTVGGKKVSQDPKESRSQYWERIKNLRIEAGEDPMSGKLAIPKAEVTMATRNEFERLINEEHGIELDFKSDIEWNQSRYWTIEGKDRITIGTKGLSENDVRLVTLHELSHHIVKHEGTFELELYQKYGEKLATEIEAWKWTLKSASEYGLEVTGIEELLPKKFPISEIKPFLAKPTPIPKAEVTAPISVQTGLEGMERPAQMKAFEEFGGAPGAGGAKPGLVDIAKLKAQQAAKPLPGQVGLPESNKIEEITTLLNTSGRLPKGQGTKPELRLELARLEAQEAIKNLTTPSDLQAEIERVGVELQARSRPYHAAMENTFPQYDAKQLDEYMKVLEEAQPQDIAIPPQAPSAIEIRNWRDMGLTPKDIAELKTMSPELRELTTHQARITGFRNVSDAAIDDYLQKALILARKTNDANAIKSIEAAIGFQKSGELQDAILESEKGLGYIHKSSSEAQEHIAEMGRLQPVTRTIGDVLSFPESTVAPTPEAVQPVSEGVTPTIPPTVTTPKGATEKVNAIQAKGKATPTKVKPADARYAHIEKAAPDGPKPPKPPPSVAKGVPSKDPRELLAKIFDNQLKGESLSETAIRLYGGATRSVYRRTSDKVAEGSQKLKEQGVGQIKLGKLVVRDADKPIIDELNVSLHNPSGVASGEVPIPKGYEEIYQELRELADWTSASTLDADPNAMLIEDWFFRGWKPPEGMFTGAPGKGGLVTKPKPMRMPRVDATYQEMRDLGFEPLFWNPYDQWAYRHNLGEIYREQMDFVDYLKSLPGEIIKPDMGGPLPAGWKVPRIGPAFEGKPFATVDADGNPAVAYSRRWATDAKTATILESMFGKRPELTLGVGNHELNVMAMVDWVAFTPKRAKLFISFFQQVDFLNRSGGGSWAKAIDDIQHGKPIDAAVAVLRWPKTAYDILIANFSPGKRLSLAQQMDDTTPLVEGRPGVHMKGISEAGLSTMDVTIFADEMDKLMRSVAEHSGVWSKFKGLGSAVVDLESAMRRGLFQGTYPAAMTTDIKNNIAMMMTREHPTATDAQINGYIATQVNKKYSTLPPEQSVFHRVWIRELLRRLFFSFSESEALTRQATGMFHGPNKAFWTKQMLGVFFFLAVVANIIHMASTGKPLPKERYVPIAKDNWGPLPFGYNPKFLSPTLPFKGRGGAELTVDLMGQQDTVLRILSPGDFLTARLSVPARTLMNQVSGTDFYGASMDTPGQRVTQFGVDMFAPIGLGGIIVEGARQGIPGAKDVFLEQESRLGMAGLGIQATGINIRAESTRQLLDRAASESGFQKADGTPAQSWSELEPHQKIKVMENKELTGELTTRSETSVERGMPGAAGYAELEGLTQKRITRGEALVTEFDDNLMDANTFRDEVTKLKTEISSKKSQVDEDFQLFQDTQDLPQDPNKRALVEYYSIFDKAKRESESIDWDRVEQWEAAYRQYWTPSQEAYVDRNIGLTEWGPKMQEYVEAQKVLSDSGYWDIAEPNQYAKRMSFRLQHPEVETILQKWYGYQQARATSSYQYQPRKRESSARVPVLKW